MEADTLITTPTVTAASHHQQQTASAASDQACMPPPVFYQPKLSINAPNDPLEQEADAMADKVMRMPAPEIGNISSAYPSISRQCAECEKEEHLQRKESNGQSTPVAPPIIHQVLNSSGGKSLDNDTRSFMEPRFNYDFSNVK